MPATKYDIVCEQGADLHLVVTYYDTTGAVLDLTGGSARMQVRKTLRATAPMVDLGTDDRGGLTIVGAAGTITIAIAAAITDGLDPGEAVYDMEFVGAGGDVSRVIEGKFTVVQQVTR